MPFNKVLVAYDGSKAANSALDKAIELHNANTSDELEIVHVLQIPNLILGEGIIPVSVNIRNDYYEASEKVVAEVKERVASLPHPPKVTMLEGGPAEAVLSYAERGEFDLIVIGSRGLGGIREFFLGSVSHNIVQHAKIPVLIVK